MVDLDQVVSNMKTVFLVVGETSSGKDTFVQKICEDCEYKQLISYATRPRRDGEGETHIFISSDDVKEYVDKMIAYTKIGEFEYFATIPQLYESDFYVIDPQGVEYMKFITQYKGVNDVRFVTIYINTPAALRKERALNTRKDNPEVYFNRTLDEQEQFTNFKAYAKYDYAISNVDFDKAYKIFKYIVEEELNEAH
jgi:guanylate kinase